MFMNLYSPVSPDNLALYAPNLSGGWFGSNGRPSLSGADAYNKWQHYTYVIDFGSGGGATNGWATVYLNGTARQTWRNIAIPHMGADGVLALGNYVRHDLVDYNGRQSAYWESLYIDRTLSRVEVGNSPINANATHREIQVPTAWSSSNVSVRLNRGSFPNFSGLYLYVVDDNDNASDGFPLGGNQLPTVPRNLRIVPGAP